MRAMDIMTTDVITVDPDMTVQDLAKLLAERGISGAPVVDASGRLVGIVSEGDLCTALKSALRAATASVGVRGGLTISPPISPAITSNRMAVPSKTS
jgi:CBS domain-containing protein